VAGRGSVCVCGSFLVLLLLPLLLVVLLLPLLELLLLLPVLLGNSPQACHNLMAVQQADKHIHTTSRCSRHSLDGVGVIGNCTLCAAANVLRAGAGSLQLPCC
jgi:hypothetical protein